jgi:4-amino-4-deoxy-L-arabinose transferase-like glycosyltransferase
MAPKEAKSNTYYFILLFIIAFVFRVLLLVVFKFDGLYGQDAYGYLEYSKKFYGAIANFRLPPSFFWPIGFPLLTSVFTVFTAGNVWLAGLLVSLNSGSLCAGFVYLMTYELFSSISEEQRKKTSLYAGLITAFIPLLVKSSIVLMSDALAIMFASWSMWQVVKYTNEHKLKHMIFASITLSFAVMTRYGYALLVIPILIYIIFSSVKNKAKTGVLIRDLIISSVIGIIIFIPQLYYIIQNGIPGLQHGEGAGVWPGGSPLNFFRKDFTTFDGTMHYRMWNALYNLSPVFHPFYLSVFGFAFLAGAYLLLKRKNYKIIILALSWLLVYYLYFSGGSYQALRFLLSFMPAMVIISAYGLAEIKLKETYKNLFLYIGLAVFAVFMVYHMSVFTEQKNKEFEVVNWVNKDIPASSKIFAFDVTLAINHYTKINADEFFNNKVDELKNKIDSYNGDIYFILPVEVIKAQWKGLPLEKKFDFIMKNYPLQKKDTVNKFTIFKLQKKK